MSWLTLKIRNLVDNIYYGVVPEASVRMKVDFDNKIDAIQSNFSFATADGEIALARGGGRNGQLGKQRGFIFL